MKARDLRHGKTIYRARIQRQTDNFLELLLVLNLDCSKIWRSGKYLPANPQCAGGFLQPVIFAG